MSEQMPVPIVDAEFEVITPAPQRLRVRWTWRLRGLVLAYYAITWGGWLIASVALALLARWAYPHVFHFFDGLDQRVGLH